MTKKKATLLIVLCVLLTFGILYAAIGYLPIFGSMIAGQRVNRYLDAAVGSHETVPMRFDFYSFSGYKGGGYLYDLRSGFLFDSVEAERLHVSSAADIQKAAAALPDTVTVSDAHITCYHHADAPYPRVDRLVIYNMTNTEDLLPDQSRDRALSLVQTLLESDALQGYSFTSVNITYWDRHGAYQIAVPFPNQTPLTREILAEHLEKAETEPALYQDWKAASLSF